MQKIFFVLSLFLFAIALNSCKPDSKHQHLSPDIVNNPTTANGKANLDMVPVFEFESDNHEFGEIKQGEVVAYNFKFKNAGKAPLVITSASASCGCTVPEYSKDPVPPGENGFIKVTFDSEGKHGMVSKNVTLLANTIPNTKVLTISAEILNPESK